LDSNERRSKLGKEGMICPNQEVKLDSQSKNHLGQGLSALKRLGSIAFKTWPTYFDWGLL
jgi:hypothetical protein